MLVLRDRLWELLVLVVFIIVWSGGVCSSTAALVLACMLVWPRAVGVAACCRFFTFHTTQKKRPAP